jgi:hypothetical protein
MTYDINNIKFKHRDSILDERGTLTIDKTYDINNLDKFDEKNFWRGVPVNLPDHYKKEFKSFILQDRQEAYNAGRQSMREEIKQELLDISKPLEVGGKGVGIFIRSIEFTEVFNKLKQ